jgi:hypothetical protein
MILVDTSRLSSFERTEIMRLRQVYGNAWTKIARHLPGRSAVMIKNWFHNGRQWPRNAIVPRTYRILQVHAPMAVQRHDSGITFSGHRMAIRYLLN